LIQVKDNVYWIGLKDWELRRFHGHEYSTHRGSSYNTYLIRDEKNILVDTVWTPFKNEFIELIGKEVGFSNVHGIIVNHNEPDHGGCLDALMDVLPKDTPIYCSPKGVESIRKHFHKDWNFVPVKTGDKISTGKSEIMFMEMTMIHWPDSMAAFVTPANVLLSNDAFGQHYASASIFEDEADQCEVNQEALKYFANILTPLAPLIRKKLADLKSLNLPIEVIAPSHGVIWRKDPLRIVEKYAMWANDYHEGFVTIVYDTMYNSTKKMAEAIAKGIEKEGVRCKLYNSSATDISDLITELFLSKGIVIGSCTVNNHYLRSIAGLMSEIKVHKFSKKLGAAFGSSGWSNAAPEKIHEQLKDAGIEVVLEPLGVKFVPTAEELEKCVEFGEEFARKVKASI